MGGLYGDMGLCHKLAYMHLKILVFEPLVYVHTLVFKGSQQYC